MKFKGKSRRFFLKQLGIATTLLPVSTSLQAFNAKKATSLKPAPLKKGDTIGIVAPGFALPDPQVIKDFAAMLKEEGYQIKMGEYVFGKHGYFSGTDAERASDLNTMFADKEVNAIVAARGGWGGARILPILNYESITSNPKIFIGYSDITSLLLGIYQKTGLVTFHGPVGTSDWNKFSYKHFKKVIIKEQSYSLKGNKKSTKNISKKTDPDTDRFTITEGKANGIMIGGNLTVLCGMVGSEYLPDFEGKILLLEDVGEAVYRIDRYLTHLKLAGILDKLAGVVFATCAACEKETDRKDNFTLSEILKFHLAPLGIPAFFGIMSGHLDEQYTLPMGINVEIDAKKGKIKLLEEAVS
ncbi:MAG: LD-carboxypeptidase [Bacteroidota bacterium]